MIYLLTRHDDYTYVHARGFVVIAKSVKEARLLASTQAGFEGEAFWLDPANVTCEELKDVGEPRVVIRDYWHG